MPTTGEGSADSEAVAEAGEADAASGADDDVADGWSEVGACVATGEGEDEVDGAGGALAAVSGAPDAAAGAEPESAGPADAVGETPGVGVMPGACEVDAAVDGSPARTETAVDGAIAMRSATIRPSTAARVPRDRRPLSTPSPFAPRLHGSLQCSSGGDPRRLAAGDETAAVSFLAAAVSTEDSPARGHAEARLGPADRMPSRHLDATGSSRYLDDMDELHGQAELERELGRRIDENPLDALTTITALRRAIGEHERAAVFRALETHSWREVGEALGVSKQAAFQRFGRDWVRAAHATLPASALERTIKDRLTR